MQEYCADWLQATAWQSSDNGESEHLPAGTGGTTK